MWLILFLKHYIVWTNTVACQERAFCIRFLLSPCSEHPGRVCRTYRHSPRHVLVLEKRQRGKSKKVGRTKLTLVSVVRSQYRLRRQKEAAKYRFFFLNKKKINVSSVIQNKDNLQTGEYKHLRYCGKAEKTGQCCLGGAVSHDECSDFWFCFETSHIYLSLRKGCLSILSQCSSASELPGCVWFDSCCPWACTSPKSCSWSSCTVWEMVSMWFEKSPVWEISSGKGPCPSQQGAGGAQAAGQVCRTAPVPPVRAGREAHLLLWEVPLSPRSCPASAAPGTPCATPGLGEWWRKIAPVFWFFEPCNFSTLKWSDLCFFFLFMSVFIWFHNDLACIGNAKMLLFSRWLTFYIHRMVLAWINKTFNLKLEMLQWNVKSSVGSKSLTSPEKKTGPVRFTFEEVLCLLKEADTFLPVESFSDKALW